MGAARTEDQEELASVVRSLLERRGGSAQVRAAVESDAGHDADLWTALCEQIGVAALPVPERYDGAGASLAETAVVLEELGRTLSPVPLLASALDVTGLLLHGTEEERAEMLPRLAAGEVRPVSLGTVVLEPDDGERRPAMDPTLRLGPASSAQPPPDDVRDVAAALVSALQVGTAQRGLEMTVAYSRERVQFGRPIGSFQALKHRMADLLVLVEASRSASWAATSAAAAYVQEGGDASRHDLARLSAVARSYCSEALEHVAAETVQLHGGIAITWEHDAQLVLKRAHALAQLLEPARAARARVLDRHLTRG